MRASSVRRSTRLTSFAIWLALGGSGRSRQAMICRSCGTVTAGFFPPQPVFLLDQEPQSQQRQGHVVVPAHPTPQFVMVQPYLAFACLQQFFDVMTPTVDAHHLFQGRRDRRVRKRVPGLRLLFDRAYHHQSLARAGPAVLVAGLHPSFYRPHHFRSLSTVAAPQLAPAPRWLCLGPIRDAPPGWPALPRGRRLAQIADQRVRRHVEHIPAVPVAQLGPKAAHPPEFVVTRHPAERQSRCRTIDQRQSDAPSLLKRHLRRYVGSPPPLAIQRPVAGQIELAVQRGIAARRCVGQKHAHLTVVDFAESATRLRRVPAVPRGRNAAGNDSESAASVPGSCARRRQKSQRPRARHGPLGAREGTSLSSTNWAFNFAYRTDSISSREKRLQ